MSLSNSENIFEYNNSGLILSTLYVPAGKTKIYQSAAVWQDFYNIQEYDFEASIENYETTPINVQASAGTVTISGADLNAPVSIYTTSGMLVKSAKGNATLSLDSDGVYIIKVGEETFKVRM